MNYKYIMDYLAWESHYIEEMKSYYPNWELYDVERYPPQYYEDISVIPSLIQFTNTDTNDNDFFKEVAKRIGPINRIFFSSYFENPNNYYNFINSILWSIEKLYKKQISSIRGSGLVRKKWSKVSDNRLIVTYDSGGFQHMANRMKPKSKQKSLWYYTPERCIEIYNTLGYENQDILIQADYPIIPIDSEKVVKDLYTKNIKSLEYMFNISKNVIGTIHGWTKHDIDKHIIKINDITGRRQIAFGGFTSLKNNSWRRKLEKYGLETKNIWHQIIDRMIYCIKKNYNKDIFVMGAGNPQFMHILFAYGIRWVDGASWRIDAQFGRIYILENTPIGIARRKKPVARQKTIEDEDFLERLISGEYDNYKKFLIYPLGSFAANIDDLYNIFENGIPLKTIEKGSSFTARALHNAFVCRLELDIANKIIREDPTLQLYKKYIKNRFRNSPYYKGIVNYFSESWEKEEVPDFEFYQTKRIKESTSDPVQKRLDMFFNTY